jgi:hypothetical protein
MKPAARPSQRPARPPDLEVFPRLDARWPANGLGPVAVVLSQLPDPTDLANDALVIVRESGPPARGFSRVVRQIGALWRKAPRAHAAVRCTALLARGYRDIGSELDPRTNEALVWGFARRG